MRPPLLFAALLLTACNNQPNQPAGQGAHTHGPSLTVAREGVDDVFATVSGAPIGAADLQLQASRSPAADGKAHTDAERLAIANQLIEEEVLFQEALKQKLYQDTKVRKILVNLLLREKVYSQVKNDSLTEEELKAYYESHKQEFITPEKVQVRRILLRIREDRDDAATRAEADRLFKELRRDPRLFSDLATHNSDGPYKRRGGDLGFVSKEGKPGVDASVIERAFNMKKDEISPPFKAGSGYHILQLVNRRERTERSFEQMKGSVVRMVKQGKHEELKKSFIKNTRANYDVTLDEKKLKTIDTSRRSLLSNTKAPTPPKKDDGRGH